VIEMYAGQTVTATFTAQASGSVPIYYQWNQNGSPIANATNSSYTFTNTVALGNTLFTCTVTNQYNGYSSTNAGPATVVGIASPVVFGTTNQYQVTVLGDKPIAYWRLDEGPDNGSGNDGTIANDYVGGHNGTYTNVELGFAGIGTLESTDTATLFNTFNSLLTNSYVGEINNTGNGVSPINFGEPSGSNGEFSVECWVNLTTNLGGGIVAKGSGNGGEQFCLDTGNTTSHDFRFFVRNAAGTTSAASSTVTPVVGSWYHLVGVCNESNSLVILYVDGVSNIATAVTLNSGILSSTDTVETAANYVSIGSRTSSSSVTNMNLGNSGLIQDVALYNYPLSAAKILAHYQASGLYVVPINPNPTNIVTSVTNGVLYLKWPTDHTGWQLQALTNSVNAGIATNVPIGNNWANYNPSTGTNLVAIPINLTNGTVFYRLTY
jgi:Concanavalin A-like lectin/glucanases superfamily